MYSSDNMYYSDNLYNVNKKYKHDALQLNDVKYNLKKKLTNDVKILKNEKYIIVPKLKNELLNHASMNHALMIPLKYKEDNYNTIQYGDTEFYFWLKTQSDPSVGILAEIVNSPKLNITIEKIRENIKNMDTISIESYRKIKCLGSRQVNMLKQLKTKYGENILKFLKYTLL
jgi:hypothetical protein